MKNELTIYHGSPMIIELPTFGKGNPNNDYGLGFYCTESLELAKEYISEKFLPDYQSYDIIIGYRADDSYFSFAAAFLNNTISLSQLEKAMVLGKLGEQIVAKSEKAFDRLAYIESIPAGKELYYPKKLARDNGAREEFRKEKSRTAIENEVYVLDIIREGWDNNDARLQRIVLG